MIEKRKVSMLGVPMDLGGGLRGVDMGPSAIRVAGLEERVRRLGCDFEDLGDLPVQRPEGGEVGNPQARYLKEIARCCAELRDRVRKAAERGCLPLVVGGDHSIACGTVAGLSSHYHSRGEKIGLIWFDAHGDFNTPEISESGNIHGMPLASITGFGPPELVGLGDRKPMVDVGNAVLVGCHELDRGERALMREAGINVFTVRDIDVRGMHKVMREAIEIATDGTVGFHMSYDIDGVDPVHAPGVGTPVRGGMTLREAHLIMEHVGEADHLLGLEVAEINPILDNRNQTADLAVELLLSALGKLVF